MFNGWFIFI